MNINDTNIEILRNNVGGGQGAATAYGFRINDDGFEIEPGGAGVNRRPAYYGKTIGAAEFTDPDHIPNVRYVDDAIAGAGGDYETAQTYTVSNVTPDRVFDPTATTPNETAHVLATLIQDLKNLTDILL